jgi:hypothetical protein
MKIESEKLLEKKLRVKIESIGGLCWKLPTIHLAGIPDRMCLIPGGVVVFAEIKTTEKEPEKLQLLWHKRLRKLGFRVEIIDKSCQIIELVNEFKNEK